MMLYTILIGPDLEFCMKKTMVSPEERTAIVVQPKLKKLHFEFKFIWLFTGTLNETLKTIKPKVFSNWKAVHNSP